MKVKNILLKSYKKTLEGDGLFKEMVSRDCSDDALFRWRNGKNIQGFLGIQINDESEMIFKLVGYWTRTNLNPFFLPAIMCPHDCPDLGIEKDEPIEGCFSFDVGSLWNPKQGKLWTLENDSFDARANTPFRPSVEAMISRVESAVSAGYTKIVSELIPYFNEMDQK